MPGPEAKTAYQVLALSPFSESRSFSTTFSSAAETPVSFPTRPFQLLFMPRKSGSS